LIFQRFRLAASGVDLTFATQVAANSEKRMSKSQTPLES
jgi:hypothetical protein